MDFFNRQDSKLFESDPAQKQIRVFRNGDHTIKADLTLKPSVTFQQLKVDILRKLGLKDTGVFRLFTSEGLELYDDYIPLIKDKESLFVSLGEGFDQTTTLREYVEIETIGEGGFGKVVLVQHKVTKKKYAIKYVDARHYGLASLIDMVFSEAELLKNLKHKNIVEIISFFKLRDLRVVFMMEYLEGGELGAYLKSKGRLNEEEAKELFKQLLDAVHFCHMNKIIHRDLKPENILFVSKNSKAIKVVDFGIAGLYSGFNFDVSDAGSLRYMAPEILSGKNKAANPAMDVWSMGCILYTLFHGQPPFSGSNRDIKDAILKGEYKFDPQVKSKLSPECVNLIERMLIVDYNQRISTFGIKEHPWLTGEKNALKTQPTQEEAKELKAANGNLENEMPPIPQKKSVVALKNLRDKGASQSFNLKSKNSVPESKASAENSFKMPGQNTLRRAISKEARRKSDINAEKPLKKLDQKSSFADPKNKEKNEVKKGLPLLGRKFSRNMRDIDESEGNLKGTEKV